MFWKLEYSRIIKKILFLVKYLHKNISIYRKSPEIQSLRLNIIFRTTVDP